MNGEKYDTNLLNGIAIAFIAVKLHCMLKLSRLQIVSANINHYPHIRSI